ncbi:protein of unknown function [Duganella sp. CF458]|uniref:DUF4153 domain-containing protein n=1 Tax=Duganella sp. CF458 TaxID=1884368 RepID=UPI0008E9E2EF|nr:DUF4153 domain-containing protein [Duganella sp. CF458]SFF92005.1 protein of unknown function [Duganella sp. CF458]
MEATTQDTGLFAQEPVRDAAVTRRVGQLRLIAGLLQGGLLYFLYRSQQSGAWPANHPMLYVPLLMAGIVLPVLLISSLGHLERRPLAWWLGAAAAVLAAVGMHDAWRNAFDHAPVLRPSFLLFPFCIGFFFVAHSLVMAGAHDRRWVAQYATCFESAWKLAIQLLFSALFVLGIWLVMWMGAALFGLLKLDFLERLLLKPWFSVPLVCLAFSSAMHTTDVRPAIVRGIRSLLLVLMAWILPIAVLLVGGFLASLTFTGLEVLWQTRHATAVLLASCAVLVVLVNAAFQAGDAAAGLARVVRFAARVACFLLPPLTVLGVYALGLRVADYGWTADRVIAAACLVVALFYAGGYLLAAVRRGGSWLDGLRQVNIAAAFLALAVSLAMFTPFADPARISVADQVARLARGTTPAEKFDYGFLRYHGARYGMDALQALAAHGTGPQAEAVRTRAADALNEGYEDRTAKRAPVPAAGPPNLDVWPKGAQLPAGFLKQDWMRTWQPYPPPACMRGAGTRCDAIVLDGDGDGRPDVLVLGVERGDGAALLSERNGRWEVIGRPSQGLAGCPRLQERLRAGQFKFSTTPLRDIEVGGQRIVLVPPEPELPDCDGR